MKKRNFLMAAILAGLSFATSIQAQDVGITKDTMSVQYTFSGTTYVIQRNQDPEARIDDAFAKTSRACPPFCVQPVTVHEGVNTVGELELLDFMTSKVSNGEGFLIDSRTSDWYVKGTIPGAVNIPFNVFVPGTDNMFFTPVMNMLGGRKTSDGQWTFDNPKELLLFCNGPWCEQSPTAIRNLIAINYPAEKLHYYRGGMQDWSGMGFDVQVPEG